MYVPEYLKYRREVISLRSLTVMVEPSGQNNGIP